MLGQVYAVHGDITKCQADAIAFSTSTRTRGKGKLYGSFAQLDGFSDEYAKLHDQEWKVGDTHWIPPLGQRPGIVVSFSIGDFAAQPAVQAAEIVRSAIRCAVKNLRASAPNKRLLVLLPTFLTGAGGANRMRPDLARVQLRAAKEAITELPGVDVAFVLFQPSDHVVFRDACRELRTSTVAVTPDAELADAIRRRECVVFVGSGLSAGARMVSWAGLIEELRKSITDLAPNASTTTSEHLAVAQQYRDATDARGLKPLREVVRDLFGSKNPKQPTLSHFLIASLGARHVITTNYDHLLEKTFAAVRQRWLPVTQPIHVPETGSLGRVNIVKFHGDAEDGDDVVASARDYEDFFDRHPVFDLLLSGLLLNQTFLFIGYSLTDPNFKQIYNRIARLLGAARRRAFATSFGPPADKPPGVEVIRFDGSIEDQTSSLRSWLDALVDHASAPESVLLADAADTTHVAPTALVELRTRLLQVGAEVARLTSAQLSADDARTVAQIAATLFGHGWRSPAGNDRMLEELARKLADPAEQESLLRVALSQADSRDAVTRIEQLLSR